VFLTKLVAFLSQKKLDEYDDMCYNFEVSHLHNNFNIKMFF
jgi:hypothetical protein